MSIILNKINCFYGTYQVIFDVNLTCLSGDIVVLLGPSGAGKSTLLRVFNLLEIPSTGQLDIAGNYFDFSNVVNIQAVRLLRQNVGMVFQQYHLWPHLTVRENLTEAPCRVQGLIRTTANARADKLLHRLQLTHFANRFPSHLSGGEQQRVAIARALMMQPQVLLFDEPTSALDPEITAQFVNIINELSQTGITQVIVTHEIDVARKTANHIIYMEKGKIIEQGDVSHLVLPQTTEFARYLSH